MAIREAARCFPEEYRPEVVPELVRRFNFAPVLRYGPCDPGADSRPTIIPVGGMRAVVARAASRWS